MYLHNFKVFYFFLGCRSQLIFKPLAHEIYFINTLLITQILIELLTQLDVYIYIYICFMQTLGLSLAHIDNSQSMN